MISLASAGESPGFVHHHFLVFLKLYLYSVSFEYVFDLSKQQMAVIKCLYLTWHFLFHIPLLFIAHQSPVHIKGGSLTFRCSYPQMCEYFQTHSIISS